MESSRDAELAINLNGPHATLTNLANGLEYVVRVTHPFAFGSSLACDIISRDLPVVHCFIRYKHNMFLIFDNKTISGTFVKGHRLIKENHYAAQLKDGYVINFGNINQGIYEFSFIFHLVNERTVLSGNMAKELASWSTEFNYEIKEMLVALEDFNNYMDTNIEHLQTITKNYAKENKKKSLQISRNS